MQDEHVSATPSLPEPPKRERRPLRESTAVKMVVLGFLILVLLIPVVRIAVLVQERESRQRTVQAEVADLWGHQQVLVGPVLKVPFEVYDPKEERTSRHEAFFLPTEVDWQGSLEPEIRYRGMFEVVVYESRLAASGRFTKPALPQWQSDQVAVLWEQATVSLGIPDVRGLQGRADLAWGEQILAFEPGADAHFLSSGIHVATPGLRPLADDGEVPFSFAIALRGSERLAIAPVGEETGVRLASTWNDPSFDGSFLPTEREVTEAGFTASWQVPYFGRNFPQQWTDGQVAYGQLYNSAFGVELILPADGYQQTTRSVKYAVLFILLTFVTFFLIEVVSPVRLHAAQYLLVGFALCLFYVLLLALSEHLGFGIAYAVATVAIVALIAGYSRSILASSRWATVLGGCLAGLYGYLYVLLQLEEYALLLGALGLFVILAAIMYLTRNLDWGTLRFRPSRAEATG